MGMSRVGRERRGEAAVTEVSQVQERFLAEQVRADVDHV